MGYPIRKPRPSAAGGAARPAAVRRKPAHPEDDLQGDIVAFHGAAVAQSDAVLFAVPNGEKRDALTAARLTGLRAGLRDLLPDAQCLQPFGLGVLEGASDLVLLTRFATPAVLIEVKIPRIVRPPALLPLFGGAKGKPIVHEAGRQTRGQKRFQAGVEQLGVPYRLLRSVEAYADLLEELGVPLRCRPWGPGVVSPRPPVGF